MDREEGEGVACQVPMDTDLVIDSQCAMGHCPSQCLLLTLLSEMLALER